MPRKQLPAASSVEAGITRVIRPLVLSCLVATAAVALTPDISAADEGGVSFWVPGFFGSLAAIPQQPGWSLATIYYHTSVSGGAGVAFARESEAGKIPVNLSGTLNASLTGSGNIGFIIPSYVFGTPVLGGQAAVTLVTAYGCTNASVNGTLMGILTGPNGNSIPFTRSDSIANSACGIADLIPQTSLRWNNGVNNYLAYLTGDVPAGFYNPNSIANMGIGHSAIDAGGGYTYLNPKVGQEFSGVLGFTYNFLNPATQYQNGLDMHFDWGASQFVTKQLLVGVVGYAYRELGCDSGVGDRVGCFQSQVFGAGPQVGFNFPVGNMQGYINLKAYKEFAARNRADGWNAWLTFAISPEAPTVPTPHQYQGAHVASTLR